VNVRTAYGSQKKKEIISLNSVFGFVFPMDTEYVSVNVEIKGQMSAADKLLVWGLILTGGTEFYLL
jgi:hypothetical protein